MKTIAPFLLLCGLLMIPITAFSASFPDIQDSEFKTYIEFLSDNSIISGYPDGTFKPDNNITNGEALKILYESAEFAGVEGADVSYSSDLSTYFMQAKKDFPGLTFGKDGLATRGDMTYIAMNLGHITTAESTIYYDYDNPFVDVNTSDDRYDAIIGAYHFGFIRGYDDGSFKPDRYITRGEFSKITYNIFFNEDSPIGSCYENNGHYGPGSTSSGSVCYSYYQDGGRSCDDSRDCDGACLVTDTTETVGTCQEKEPLFGCVSELYYNENLGEVELVGICLD